MVTSLVVNILSFKKFLLKTTTSVFTVLKSIKTMYFAEFLSFNNMLIKKYTCTCKSSVKKIEGLQFINNYSKKLYIS